MLRNAYYRLKPFIPRSAQLALRRLRIAVKMPGARRVWPIDPATSAPPPHWSGWPGGKQFAFVLTHDVEWDSGQQKCPNLMDLEARLGFRSSFNLVPERYTVSDRLRQQMVEAGFEVGVHGLKHDGREFESEETFNARAVRINHYLQAWSATGFRAPAMHHNLEWIARLNIDYDASSFDTDPFEPQPDSAGTIFPFLISQPARTYVELPYTLPQDFTLFILMREKNADLWKRKVDWIAEKGGMVLVDSHPDYMNFDGGHNLAEEYPAAIYEDLLNYVKTRYNDAYWHALPRDVANFWRTRSSIARR